MANADSTSLGRLPQSGGTVRYRLLNQPPHTQPTLSPEAVRQIVATAFGRWERVSNFRFEHTDGGDWTIGLQFGELSAVASAEWCSANPDAIAVTTFHGSGQQRMVTFSQAVNWNKMAQDAAGTMVNPVLWFMAKSLENSAVQNLAATAVHEIGHALGLAHSDDPGSIMQPVLSLANGSVLYFLRSQALPDVDIRTLQALYGRPEEPKPPADNPEGYALVGSSFCVGTTDSLAFRSLAAANWGEFTGTSVALMDGYVWDQEGQQRGYGRWIGQLKPITQVHDQWVVVGGGSLLARASAQKATILRTDSDSVVAVVDYHNSHSWGSQDGVTRLVARTETFNEQAGVDTDCLVYLVTRRVATGYDAQAVVGVRTQIGTSSFSAQYTARTWGRQQAAHCHSLASGRTWPSDRDPKVYNNAYCEAFLLAN